MDADLEIINERKISKTAKHKIHNKYTMYK